MLGGDREAEETFISSILPQASFPPVQLSFTSLGSHHNPSTPSNSSSKIFNHFDDESETFINLDISTDFKPTDDDVFDHDDSRLISTTDEQSQFKSSDSTFGMGLNHFVRVFIPSHTTEVDIEGKYTSFNILVQTAFATVEVKRRYKNFLSLHQDLVQKISRDRLPQLPKKKRLGVLDPSFVDERQQSLEFYLQSLIAIREVWNCACFIEFLDLSHPFLGIHLQMTRMSEEVGRLGDENKYLLQQLQCTRSALSTSNKVIAELLHRVETLEDVVRGSLPCPCNTQQLAVPTSTSSPLTQKFSTPEQEGHSLPAEAQSQEIGTSLETRSEWWDADRQQIEKFPHLSTGIFQIPGDSQLSSLMVCPDTAQVLQALIPLQEFFHSSTLGRLTNTVLTFMTPTVEQLKLRFQVEKYIAKLVRKSLGAQVYQMGLYSIRSFLPDDPVTLSIYLCRGLENSWYLRLNEKLCRMSSSIHAQRETTDAPEDHLLGHEADSVHPPPTHIIKNVSFMEENCEHRLQCVIGNYTIDIRATQKIDLCFAAFIEEIDRTVGRDHLFKKSLILIRSWWTVEAPTYFESGMPSLPTSAVCVMVCAIFNRFHKHIYHPIHALILFLTEYASFDWYMNGLTVYGPILLSSLASEALSHERCFQLYPESLITRSIIGKYEEFLQSANPNPESERQPSDDKSLLNELFFSLEGSPSTSGSQSIAPREKYPCYTPSDSLKIFHPLCVDVNIIPAAGSEQYPSALKEILVKGRNAILPILTLATEVENSSELFKLSELESKFQLFFRETYSKYSHNYEAAADMHKTMSFESLLSFELDSSVHDVQKPSTLLFSSPSNDTSLDDSLTTEIIRDPLIAPIETLYEQIRYCNFLLGAEVSESTLQALSKDILNERGPLPVGEIGKMLQEITGISTLSAYLKDKFGGLKKFLENFPDDFVICSDHPFNPHVFMRNVLTHEDYKLITSGVLPPHLMSRGNKRRTTRKKRLSNNSLQSMYTDHNSSPSAPSGGRGMRTPGPSFRPEGLRSVMSSPYLTALIQNQSASANRYQGESWDLAANQPAGRLHHTMSSPALESLGDHNYQSYNYSYQDNYGQYAEIGYRNGEQDPFDSYDSQASYSRRRNSLPSSAVPSYQGTPVQYPTAANNYSMSSSSSVHSTMTSTDGYGHMGIPDPRAPAFIPGTGYM